jgi:hypothetical protein
MSGGDDDLNTLAVALSDDVASVLVQAAADACADAEGGTASRLEAVAHLASAQGVLMQTCPVHQRPAIKKIIIDVIDLVLSGEDGEAEFVLTPLVN